MTLETRRGCRLGAALVAGLAAGGLSAAAPAEVLLRRTTDGVAHVKAGTWRGLGVGVGQAQAEDALCTLAEAFMTYRGERSLHLGPDGRPEASSTFGKPTNLELDVFFKAFAAERDIAALRAAHPPALNALIDGYADGYNRQLEAAGPACGGAAWLQPIGPDDVLRRMVAAGLAGGYARFIPEIVNARPNEAAPAPAADHASLQSRLAVPVGEVHGIGSNMIAFGGRATGDDGGVLLGNPHWYWGGPDRFHQMHLTLPGRVDVAGVAFLGIPVVMIGFNDHVAWSHTVSSARRVGLFELALDPSDPTRHVVDGVSEALAPLPVRVRVRQPDGGIATVHRTLYRSRFGPVVDLGRFDPGFGWSGRTVLAVRDVNADNPRIFRNFFRWNQARSLDEFIAIQREEAGMPWVNTAAVGRGDDRAWYADIGAVPDVPDALRADCASPLSPRFARVDPRLPLLDGRRSACGWRRDPAAVQPGTMAAARMPRLLRDDYVANMNDSYWLANPAQPLTGFPANLGGEGGALSLRTREGHRIAAALLADPALRSGPALAAALRRDALGARASSADRFKEALIGTACAGTPPEDIRAACRVLQDWPNRGDVGDHGAVLWDAFWARLQTIPKDQFYTVPFSVEAPLDTPAAPNGADARVTQALADVVQAFRQQGRALDAAPGDERFVERGDGRLALFGGCDLSGYFTVLCRHAGGKVMDQDTLGNSYLQVVRFGRNGVEAHTLLAHGQRDSAIEGGEGLEPVLRYARKDWLKFPFHERDIARDPGLTGRVLRP